MMIEDDKRRYDLKRWQSKKIRLKWIIHNDYEKYDKNMKIILVPENVQIKIQI